MPFSQACKLPTDFSHAEGVKSCLLNRAQFFPSILRDIHGLLKRTTQNGKMLLHRSADQGNILREVYRQHGASKLQDVDPRYAMSTIYPWWRSKPMTRSSPVLKLSNWAGASFQLINASEAGAIRSASNHQLSRIVPHKSQQPRIARTAKARSEVARGRWT